MRKTRTLFGIAVLVVGAVLAVADVSPCLADGSATGTPEIAFVRSRDIKGMRVMDLMVMDATGQNLTVIDTRAGEGILAITRPTWSIDLDTSPGFQGYIVYQHMLQAYWPLYAVAINETVLANGTHTFSWGAPQRLEFAPPEGMNTFRPWHPAWSPDGKWLAVSGEANLTVNGSVVSKESGIYVMRAPLLGQSIGGTPQMVVNHPPVCPPYIAWNPDVADSKELAFSRGTSLVRQQVIVAGSPVVRGDPNLATTVVTDAFPPDKDGYPQVSQLSWGRLGIAFGGTKMVPVVGRKGAITRQAVSRLYVADPARDVALANLPPIPNTTGLTHPCWTPDGNYLLTGTGSAIVKIDPSTGIRETVVTVPNGATYSWPAWRPAVRWSRVPT